MSYLIDRLAEFNVKERFHLIGTAVGNREFKLDGSFRSQLSTALRIKVPPRHFAAMDYHINWIYAALILTLEPDGAEFRKNPRMQGGGKLIEGNQEDIDLVVIFEEGKVHHFVMIEAKGVTRWGAKELKSKARRLIAIFGENGRGFEGVRPHFVLMSPGKPPDFTQGLPEWMKSPSWIELTMEPPLLHRVTRCDENGKADQDGDFWRTQVQPIPGVPRQTREKGLTAARENSA